MTVMRLKRRTVARTGRVALADAFCATPLKDACTIL